MSFPLKLMHMLHVSAVNWGTSSNILRTKYGKETYKQTGKRMKLRKYVVYA